MSDATGVKAVVEVLARALADEPGEVHVVPYNNLDALQRVFEKHHDSIACFIVEPVLENIGIGVDPVTRTLKKMPAKPLKCLQLGLRTSLSNLRSGTGES